MHMCLSDRPQGAEEPKRLNRINPRRLLNDRSEGILSFVQDDVLLVHVQDEGDTVKNTLYLFLTCLKISLSHSDFVLLIR
jgi:hypothetical protein